MLGMLSMRWSLFHNTMEKAGLNEFQYNLLRSITKHLDDDEYVYIERSEVNEYTNLL